jgi:hypothetical protein
MARLDRAIHEGFKDFNELLDGRVEPGHDSGSRGNFFTRSFAGITPRTGQDFWRLMLPARNGSEHIDLVAIL